MVRIDDPEASMIPPSLQRLSRSALGTAAAVLLAGACGDAGPVDITVIEPPEPPATEVLSTLIVSNPLTSAQAAYASVAFGGDPFSEAIVFVALPPGSVPDGERVLIDVRGSDAGTTADILNGGFDPVPIAAAAGDTLDISLELKGGGAPLVYVSLVPPDTPPVIVRTDPPPKKRDVPLNAVMLVVFSEPIRAATLTDSSVELLLEGSPVAGTLQFADGLNLTARFTPAEPLVPGADYTLLITQEVGDLDGDALAEEARVDFSTTAPPSPGPLAIVSGNGQPGKAGSELAEPFVVRVTDAAGVGVPNVQVTWTVTLGEGVLNGLWRQCGGSSEPYDPVPTTSVLTDGDGLAQVSFMPTWFGPVRVAASVPGGAVTFTTDASDPDAALEIVPGYGDVKPWAWTRTTFQNPPLVVTVKDGQGMPVSNVRVDWGASGEGLVSGCVPGSTFNWALQERSARTGTLSGIFDGQVGSLTRFKPGGLGPNTVIATVAGVQGSPATFTRNVVVALIEMSPFSDSAFIGPDNSHSPVVPVGTRVEFQIFAETARIVSTSSPPGGVSFDSGILDGNGVAYDPENDPLFGFVPNVPGTWTFVDQVSGSTGSVTAQ